MKSIKNMALTVSLLGLFALPFPLRSQATVEELPQAIQPFTQSTSINQTVHELESLFVLMQERLSLMHDIAKYKWNADLTEMTLDEEELVLYEKGNENDAFIASFFEAQNQAAQRLQKEDFSHFQTENVKIFEEVKNFDQEIYPQLKSINKELLETLNELLVYTQNESLPEFLKDLSFSSFKNEGINRDIYDIAIEPLFTD